MSELETGPGRTRAGANPPIKLVAEEVTKAPAREEDPRFLSLAGAATEEGAQQLKLQLQAKWEKAIRIAGGQVPELKTAFERKDLTWIAVDDVRRTIMGMVGRDPGAGLDAMTVTPAVLKNGQPPPISGGNMVFVQTSIFNNPSKSDAYNFAKLVSTVIHEGFHLRQSQNKPKGEAIEPMATRAAEREAYSKQITALEKLRESWTKRWPDYAAAMGQVIEEEKALLAQYEQRRQR